MGLEQTKGQENSGLLYCLCSRSFEARPRGGEEQESFLITAWAEVAAFAGLLSEAMKGRKYS